MFSSQGPYWEYSSHEVCRKPQLQLQGRWASSYLEAMWELSPQWRARNTLQAECWILWHTVSVNEASVFSSKAVLLSPLRLSWFPLVPGTHSSSCRLRGQAPQGDCVWGPYTAQSPVSVLPHSVGGTLRGHTSECAREHGRSLVGFTSLLENDSLKNCPFICTFFFFTLNHFFLVSVWNFCWGTQL